VFASGYTASLLLPDTDFPTNGLISLLVQAEGLEYLGYMGYNSDNTLLYRVGDLPTMELAPRGPMTAVVSGWLIDSGAPLRCAPPSSPPPPADTPFENCPLAWLTSDEVQPVSVTDDSRSVNDPPNAVRVQPEAYMDFAPDPAFEANRVAHVPRYGTYLVRLVANPPTAADPERGWQVVARLAP
jgi:hypothetical protein